ncbi:MAG: glycosyltransferase [Thermoplasmata archaeon]|nr:glycosyltransferase [Thermoplasmata archaeon]
MSGDRLEGAGPLRNDVRRPRGAATVETADDLTVLTVTHDRPERVRALLGSFLRDGCPRPRRIVIVDDSGAPPDFAAEFPALSIDHWKLPRRVFISEAKNAGLARVETEFVYFIDDDNLVDPSTIAEPLGRIRSDARVGALQVAVLYHRSPDLVWVYATPFLPGRWGYDLLGRNRLRSAELENRLLPTDALPNASLVRTEAAREVGGFDPRLPIGSSGDFCQRLKRAGWAVWADTSAFIRHDVDPPGTRAFWAEHSVDAERLFFEVHDWFVYERRLHGDSVATRFTALRHAMGFLLAQQVAFVLRRDLRWGPLTLVLARGIAAGLREPPSG